jgi:hypothetical protein
MRLLHHEATEGTKDKAEGETALRAKRRNPI